MRKKATPLLSAMAMQMEPIAIMVRLRSASMAAAKFRAVGETWRQIIFDQQMQEIQTFILQDYEFSSTLFISRLLQARLSLRKPRA